MKRLFLFLLVGIFAAAFAPAAQALTIGVDTTDDEYGGVPGSCSLREAITAAQTDLGFGGCPAGSGADVVSLPAGTYTITRAGSGEDSNVTGDFDVTGLSPLSILPAGPNAKVVVDGNGLDRVYDQQSNGSLSIGFQTITGGVLSGIGEDGAGIRNAVGSLSVEGTTFSGNSTLFQGGGVAVYNDLSMVNSTVSGNSAGQNGGGIYAAGASSLTVRSSTITDNTADSNADANGTGGGFADAAATSISFYNVINAANLDLNPVPPPAPDCFSGPGYFPRFVLSTQAFGAGNCLVGFDPGNNQVVSDPDIGPLQDNGGQTPTHALLAGSQAIGTGGTMGLDQCPATDQTGRERPAGGCDIGAVQYVAPPAKAKVVVRKVLPKKIALKRGRAIGVKVVVRNSGASAASGLKVCMKPKGKAKKALKVRGKTCRKVGSLKPGKTSRTKFKLVAGKNAKKKAYRLVAKAKGKNFPKRSRSFKAKVR